MSSIIDRILADLGDEDLIDKLTSISKSDLNSLLLKIFQVQTSDITPVEVSKNFKINRFSVPSEINPVEYCTLEAELLALAQETNIKALLLSPAAPIGSCSAFGCVDQNNIVSATRGTEMLSDPTNMLAIFIANKLKSKEIDNQAAVHYCTTSRVVRAKQFQNAKMSFAHFGLFCLVSSGKDIGSYNCEKELIIKHLSYYKKLLLEKYKATLSITLRKRKGYIDNEGFFNRMVEVIKNEIPDIPLSFDAMHEDNNYYRGINFKIYMKINDELIEIGDGGFVDWIQQMTMNKKERCLISAVSLDRLLLVKNGEN